ncbi:uncharacterized protein MYCFIDRAFT_169413 [Pseudocercospora fijiensis CIRAD86]|uniref:Uncharacterized protein n=1 Tax=Pseudocercospora fijiensis (strain CIRAD86) TaxID=383855 RepID=N1Q7J3_PSEFD|nr:uncharacterized protein MYCFIDRAFT_169413 [Pseudocercospora fijiensis CIRAD86]EME87621.1 hypothetical protein MYCFIDRAFT_169413 [Pseudocercospora fijiensis CIRAD86]
MGLVVVTQLMGEFGELEKVKEETFLIVPLVEADSGSSVQNGRPAACTVHVHAGILFSSSGCVTPTTGGGGEKQKTIQDFAPETEWGLQDLCCRELMMLSTTRSFFACIQPYYMLLATFRYAGMIPSSGSVFRITSNGENNAEHGSTGICTIHTPCPHALDDIVWLSNH